MKTVDLHVRPVYHWLLDRVRAHVFLCMLGYYLEWHMRQRLAPMLYDDDDKQAAEALRASVVAKAQRSPAAVAKQTTGRAADGFPVHSFQTLLADLATLTRNTVATAIAPSIPSPSPPGRRPSRRRRSNSSASPVPSRDPLRPKLISPDQRHASLERGKLRLEFLPER